MKTATALTKSTISSVLLYMHETGASSNLQPGAGARKQMALYRELQNYINNGPDDFRKGFGTHDPGELSEPEPLKEHPEAADEVRRPQA